MHIYVPGPGHMAMGMNHVGHRVCIVHIGGHTRIYHPYRGHIHVYIPSI